MSKITHTNNASIKGAYVPKVEGRAVRTVLVTGSDGQLGRSIYDVCQDAGLKAIDGNNLRWIFTARKATDQIELDDLLDITSEEDIHRVLGKWHPDAIINCAAYTDVERAETHMDEAAKVNVEAVSLLANAAAECGALLVHFSTDYVFDGEKKSGAYTENDQPHPINAYGMSKYRGELFAQRSGADVTVIRTSALFSEYGKNFVKTMCRLMSEKESVSVVNDQTVSPTYARDLAEFVVNLVHFRFATPSLDCSSSDYTLLDSASSYCSSSDSTSSAGTCMKLSDTPFKSFNILNFTNEGMCTWYELAEEISKLIGNSKCSVRQCTSEEYPSCVARPRFSVLDKTAAKSKGNICEIPIWRDALMRCLGNLGYIRGGGNLCAE